MTPTTTDTLLIPTRQVCQRYSVSERTLDRWVFKSEQLGFPKPILINKRRYYREADLTSWERSRAKAGVHGAAVQSNPRDDRDGKFVAKSAA
jgi:predicted DNA-binding transcriptional regulator AlpA